MLRLVQWILVFLFTCSCVVCPVDAQVRGRVIDTTGRPLPFVAVATLPGLLLGVPEIADEPGYNTFTDLAGEFQVPDSLIPKDTLWLGALGYAGLKLPVGGRNDIVVTMRRGGHGDGFFVRTGLSATPQFTLRSASSRSIGNQDLRARTDYQLVVTMYGAQCEEPGSTLVEQTGSSLTIAVSVVMRQEVCTLAYVEHEVTIPVIFDKPGLVEVRLIARWNDVLRTFHVRN